MSHAEDFLTQLQDKGNPHEAVKMAAYHKVSREYLGVRVPEIAVVAQITAKELTEVEVLELCDALWEINIHETRVAVGKLIALKKVKNLTALWKKIEEYKNDLDAWAIADHLKDGASRCLKGDTTCINRVERRWLEDTNFWVRRAALVFTLCFAKKGEEPDRYLGWAAGMVDDGEWFIQKAIAWWLREVSKHNPERVRVFLALYEKRMKPFAVKEASKYLKKYNDYNEK